MNREHLKAFLWLRWRLRVNQFRKAGAVNAVLFGIFAVVCLIASVILLMVGVLVGLMFLGVGIENIALARLNVPMRWAWALFGGLFLVSAVVCFANPTDTFAGLADMLGVLFMIVGVWWMVRAFLERAINPLWWMGLISGILMTGLAFWTSGQFFIHKAYMLLVVAGIWALIQGVTSIVRAFGIRALHDGL